MLRDAKPFLSRLTAMGVFAGERLGVQVLCSPDSAYTLHTELGASMEELYPRETFFAQLLPAMGIPAAYCLSPDMARWWPPRARSCATGTRMPAKVV